MKGANSAVPEGAVCLPLVLLMSGLARLRRLDIIYFVHNGGSLSLEPHLGAKLCEIEANRLKGSNERHGEHGLAADCYCARSLHDIARPRTLLWWAGAGRKRAVGAYALLLHRLSCLGTLVAWRL